MARTLTGAFIRCPRHGTIGRMDTATYLRTVRSGGQDIYCIACRHLLEWATIHGRVTARQCDARCMGATQTVCDCACGGENHGRGAA